ncbi:MAG: hypothetical protein V1796_06440 [Pseudomonadota bacterium]
MSAGKLTIEAELEMIQRESFGHFVHETNFANGLVKGCLRQDNQRASRSRGKVCFSTTAK